MAGDEWEMNCNGDLGSPRLTQVILVGADSVRVTRLACRARPARIRAEHEDGSTRQAVEERGAGPEARKLVQTGRGSREGVG